MAEGYEGLQDIRDLFDKVIETGKIAKIHLPTRGYLVNFRQRCYLARKYERDLSRKMYDIGDPLYNKCVYDNLIIDADMKELTLVIRQAEIKDGLRGISGIEWFDPEEKA